MTLLLFDDLEAADDGSGPRGGLSIRHDRHGGRIGQLPTLSEVFHQLGDVEGELVLGRTAHAAHLSVVEVDITDVTAAAIGRFPIAGQIEIDLIDNAGLFVRAQIAGDEEEMLSGTKSVDARGERPLAGSTQRDGHFSLGERHRLAGRGHDSAFHRLIPRRAATGNRHQQDHSRNDGSAGCADSHNSTNAGPHAEDSDGRPFPHNRSVELTVVIIMLAIGVGVAASVIITFAAAQREAEMSGATRASVAPDRNHIAASLLVNLLMAGGTPPDAARRAVRQGAGVAAPVTSSIDIVSWSERFAKLATPEQRMWLLDTAVRLVADRTTPVPLRQYSALLDLSFGLGFQTDALAKLRDTYGFDYVDHAKNARPRSADRGGVTTPLYSRDQRETSELLRIIGVEGPATRAIIIAAYRKLAAQHHPDKVFGQPAEVQTAAAARFIEITRAYETLLVIYND